MASQNLLGALAITTAAYAAPANAAPENVSQDFADTNKATVVKVLGHQDASIQLGFGPDGLLQASGIAAVLSNLDGKDGVEVSNRWMFTRILLGGSDQKEVVGEAQLFQLLKGKNVNQLEELYARITGDNSGLKISKQNIVSSDGSFVLQGTISDFDAETQAKIRNFQTQLLAQADVIGTISSILLDDPDARTGLQAVIEGKTGQLLAMLDNPEKMAEFKKILEKNGTLDRDPAFLEKLASVLLRIGITAGLPIFSSGTMGAFFQNATLSIENGGVANDPWNLTARQGFGQNGAQSVDVSLDLAGLRGGLNFYDPQTSMSKSVSDITNASDTMSAAKQLVDRVNFQYGGDTQDETTRAQVIALGNAYIRSQEQLDSLPNSPAKTDAIAKNTLTYLAKVEAMQGIRWMGLFGTVTPTGWFAGPSFSNVSTLGSSANLKIGAGSIEAQILDSKALNAEQVAEYLKGLGITQEGNTYMQNGKVILTIPAGKLVQWSIEEVVTDRETIIRAVPIIISATAVPSSQIIRLTGKNSIARNAYIEKNSRDVATLAKKLRAQNSGMTDLEYSIALGNYAIATTQLKSILNGSRDKTAIGLLGELDTLNTPESKKAFFDLFLGKTAGSVVSRKLANRLENGGDIKEDLKKYYNRLAAPFAKQYRLEESQVRKLFNAILPTVDNKHISTLGETFGGGFNGMVAFNQRNTKQDFVVVATTHGNARIVGTPSVITDESVANQIRKQIKAKITEDEARVFQQNNPALKGADIDTIKSLMVAGPVSANLSFDKDAGCFNLGYVAVPGGVPVQGTSSIGSTVGVPGAGVTTFGVGLGAPWKKPKEEEPKKEEPKKEEPKPQEEKPAEPAPKPAEPAPKPAEVKPPEVKPPEVNPPEVKPPVKPPVEPPCVPPPKPPAPPIKPNPPVNPNPDVCVPKPPHVDIKPPVVPHPVHSPKPPVVPPKVDKCIPEIPKGVDYVKNFVKPGVDHGKNFVKPGVDHVKDAVTKKAAEVCTPGGTEVVKEGVKGAAKEGVKGAWK